MRYSKNINLFRYINFRDQKISNGNKNGIFQNWKSTHVRDKAKQDSANAFDKS